MNKIDPEAYIHPNALVEDGCTIGAQTRIWAFTHVLPGAIIGSDCNICDHVFIENDVLIGNSVTIKSGVQLWDGINIGNNVFVGPNVTFVNDKYPRSKQYPEEFLKTFIHDGASIGANATILGGVTIGKNAMIGAGAVVTNNVPINAIVTGNPARISGYVSATTQLNQSTLKSKSIGESELKSKTNAQLIELPLVPDLRGSLSFAEVGKSLPFEPKRYFIVFDVKSKEVRGEHAHRKLHQFLVCVKGSCAVVVDDGKHREEYLLDQPNFGIYLPPMTWAIQYKYTSDAVLLVLASDVYNADDYIRDYDEFISLLQK